MGRQQSIRIAPYINLQIDSNQSLFKSPSQFYIIFHKKKKFIIIILQNLIMQIVMKKRVIKEWKQGRIMDDYPIPSRAR